MKINPIIVIICIMASCGQNHRPSAENREEKHQNEVLMSENVLNERWYNNEKEGEDMVLPTDSIELIKWHGQPHNGTNCFFYSDSTFEIHIWVYGVSSGHHRSLIYGSYQYDSATKEIILDFNESSDQKITFNSKGKPYPTAYFTMECLKRKNGIHSGYDAEIEIYQLSKSCLKIVEQSGSIIRVDLYAYKENGERISFGQQTYVREIFE